MVKQKTIKVRIAVAVDKQGCWYASGWNYGGKPCDDGVIEQHARDELGYMDRNTDAVHFVEAEIPLPISETVKGKVV